MRNMSTCHPDRVAHGGGLCASCYSQAYRKTRPEWNKEMERRHRERHPDRRSATFKRYRDKQLRLNPRWDSDRNLKSIYGIDRPTFDALAAEQDGHCSICGVRPERLSVDHDHETGLFRGLLCSACNAALGLFNDDRDALRAAIAYLDRERSNSAPLHRSKRPIRLVS